VVSRKEIIDLTNFDLVSVFEELIRSYRIFLLLVHPKIGLWMGATPERLSDNKSFLLCIGRERKKINIQQK
jgi:isochorismate synthase